MNSGQMVSKAERYTQIEAYFESKMASKEYRKRLSGLISPSRLIGYGLSSCRKTPDLLQCSEPSILSALIQLGRLGLYPDDTLGHAYMVPFRNKGKMEVVPMIGYRGLLQLVRNSGEISTIYAEAVRGADRFEFELGLNPKLVHVPSEKSIKERGGITHVYAVCHLKDGGKQFKVMTKEEVDAIRVQSKAGKSGPWVTHYQDMAIKTVLRRLCKFLPMATEVQTFLNREERVDGGLDPEVDIEPADFKVKEANRINDLADELERNTSEQKQNPPDAEPKKKSSKNLEPEPGAAEAGIPTEEEVAKAEAGSRSLFNK